MYKLYPDNLLRLATPYGDLEMNGVKNWDSYLDIETTVRLQEAGKKEFVKNGA
jgi:hypothetical protein